MYNNWLNVRTTGTRTALLLGVAAIILSASVQGTDITVSAVEVLGYGTFDAKLTGERRITTPGAVPADTISRATFLNITNVIPARLGTNFGFQYLINTTPRGRQMKVTAVILFPGDGLVMPSGKVYKKSTERLKVEIGENTVYGYGFDEPWELVTGDWVFQIWYGDTRLLEKTFHVVEDNPQ